jgi:hypothetical protein
MPAVALISLKCLFRLNDFKGSVFRSFLLLDFDHRQGIQSLRPGDYAFMAQRPALSSGGKNQVPIPQNVYLSALFLYQDHS